MATGPPTARLRREFAAASGRAWAMVAGLFVLGASLGAYEIAPASVNPVLTADLGIDAASAGLLVSVMFGVPVVVSIPFGVVLDRVSVPRAVAVAVVAFVLAGVAGWRAAAAGSYPLLLASRIPGAFAFAVVWIAAPTLISQAFPPERRATPVGAFTASAPAGFAVVQFGGPRIAAALGWPSVFAVFGATGALGFGLFWLARPPETAGADLQAPSRADLRRVAASRAVWLLCLLAFVVYSLYLFVNSWIPTYLVEDVGLPLAQSGLLAAAFPAMGVVSRTVGGLVSDRLFGGRRRPVAVLSFLLSVPAFVGFAVSRRVVVLLAGLLVAGFALQLGLGLLYTYVREVVSGEVAATAVSMLTALGTFGGFVAPIAAGALIERAGYRPAFLLALALAVVGVALARVAPPTRAAG